MITNKGIMSTCRGIIIETRNAQYNHANPLCVANPYPAIAETVTELITMTIAMTIVLTIHLTNGVPFNSNR